MNHPDNFKNMETFQNSNIFWNFSLDKGRLKSFVSWFLTQYGEKKTIQLLEQLKELGFGYATKAGISLGIEDLKIPPQKRQLLRFAEMHLARGIISYRRGQCTGIEKMQQFIETWHETSETLKQEVVRNFEKTDVLNPVYMMAFSGARGNLSQVRQLVGMRGLMSDPQGKIIDFPIQSNFREGLTLTEYLISTYGARKGIVDTALRTATAGYLTRRLVDVAQHVVVSKFDCGTERGIFLFDMKDGPKTIYSFQNRLTGRVLARDILISSVPETLNNPNNSKKIGFRNQEITPELARGISQITKKALVRSPLTCEARKFVCQLCYGWSLATSRLVSIGEAVGVIAGQSIGEPGTQLTMRTFHTGGVFSGGITEQIHAPFDGIAQYSEPIAGTCVRTSQGELVFLTKSSGTLFFKSLQEISSSHSNSEVELEPNSSLITNAYKIPPFTLLFARHGQTVKKKNLLAQISTVTGQQKTMQTIEQTIYSNLEGEIYYSQLDLLEDIDEKSGERISKSEDWAKVWVLSGKIFKDSLNSSFFAKKFDYISKNSIINQIQWVNNFSELTKFEYLLPQFKDDSKLDFNSSFYINSNSHKKNFMNVLKRNENYMDFVKSRKFSFSPNRSLLKNSEKTLYINSKRSVRDKFLTEKIPSQNIKKIQTYSFYPFKSEFRKVFVNTLSQTILSLPIVYPGILKKVVKNKRAKSKNSQKVITYLDLNKTNQKIFIRKLNFNKNFQIYNGRKSNLFHPLVLSNYVSFFLNIQVLKYHFKRKPTIFPLVRETPIFFTNFSTLKGQPEKISSNSKKLTILKYQDELLYKKLLSKNKQIKQAFTPMNSNLKFYDLKKSLKLHGKNFLKKPLKKLYISNPTIVLNSRVNRYQKLGYLTSVQIHGNEKDEFFSFLPLKTDEIKSVNLNCSNPSKMNSQMFIQAKDNLNVNSFNTRDQNLGLKNTYSWDFPSAGGFYWYPKFSQSLTNGIFIFSSPFLYQQKLEQKILTSKTKNFKTAFLAMKKYSPFINLAQSQLQKKKNRSFCIAKNNINQKKFTSFNKYRANTLNVPSKINFSQDYKIFIPPILKRYSSRLNPIYFSNFNKKTYQNKFQSYFLNPKISHHFKNQPVNSRPVVKFFDLNNIHFKNSYSKVNGYFKKNIENRLFLAKKDKNNLISKQPETLFIKFDLSKKLSVSCHEIYWLPQETYLVNTWLKQNQCEKYRSNNILCTERTSQPSFKSFGPSFYSTNIQGFKKEFNFKQKGIYTLKVLNKSSRLKNTFQLKKTNKSDKKLLKRKTDKVVFKENFQLPFDSLKNQIFWSSDKNFNFSKKSTFSLKLKFLNFLKMRRLHNISEFKFKKSISKDFQMQHKQFENQPINFSSPKKMPYKSFLSFVPFVKRKTLGTSINFDPDLKKSKLKKTFKVYKKRLQITVKSGWVYKITNSSNILNLDKTWIDFGQLIINDVCFEHQKVFVEILSVSDKLEKDLIKLPQQSPQLPNHFKPSIFIKNPKCRFYKNLANDKKKFDKTKISNPLNFDPNKEIFLFIRPLNYSILPNLYEMKKNLNVAIQKTKNKSRNISYFIHQKYCFDCLNTQTNPTQLISQFPPFDFQLNWSNSFNRPNRFLKESVLEKVKWKKKQSQKKTFQKINLINSILELQKFKNSILFKQQKYLWTNSYLSVSHKIKYNISNQNNQNIYFSQYPVNFLKLKVSLNNSTINFSSISKVSLNSSVFESDNLLKPFQNQGLMNKQIQAAYLDILRHRSFKQFVGNKNQNDFIPGLNLSQTQTNSSQTFKLKMLSKVSFHSKKLVSFKLFSNVGTSIPNFELSFLEKYAYFANQRIFSSYFYKQQMSNYLKLSVMNLKNYSDESLNIKRFVLTNSSSSRLSEAYYDSPIITNQFISNYSNLKTQKILGLTNFYSPFEGEVLKIYSPTQELNILKNGFNTILEQGFLQDRQNQKLILTKSDLFSLKFIPTHKPTDLDFTKNEQQSRKEEIQQFKNESSKDFLKFSKKPIIKKSFQTLCDFHQEFQRAEANFNIAVSQKNYQIQNVNMLYNNKRYKVKEISFSLFSDLKKIRLGQFLSPGDLLNGQLTLKNCGQVIHYNSEKLTLRKAEFFSLSPKAILHKYNGHFLRKNSPVMTLPFQTLKTGDIVQGIPKVEQYLEARTTLQGRLFLNSLPVLLHAIFIRYLSHLEMEKAVRQSFLKIQQILVDGVQRVYRSQGVSIADKHLEIIVRQMTSKVKVIHGGQTGFFPGELLELEFVEKVNQFLMVKIRYEPVVLGITRASLEVDSFLSAASFQQTTKILTRSALENKKDFLKGLKENLLVGNLLPAGTGYVRPIPYE